MLQSGYGGFIYSFGLKSIADMNKTEGAYLNAVYWVNQRNLPRHRAGSPVRGHILCLSLQGSFALGRLFSIALATVLSSAFMLLCNMVRLLTSYSPSFLAQLSRSFVADRLPSSHTVYVRVTSQSRGTVRGHLFLRSVSQQLNADNTRSG